MMKRLSHSAAVCAALFLTGCATFSKSELQDLNRRGVSAPLVERLDQNRPLTPTNLVEFSKARVPDRLVVRHLEINGINYVVTRSDVLRLRRAGVSPFVIDAVLRESDRFAGDYAPRDVVYTSGYGYYDPYYADDYGWGVGFGF